MSRFHDRGAHSRPVHAALGRPAEPVEVFEVLVGQFDIERRITHTASEHSTQLAVVAAGLGAAIIPRLGRGPAPEGVRFVPLLPAPRRRVFTLWRNSTTNRPACRAALRALQDAARQCDTDRVAGSA